MIAWRTLLFFVTASVDSSPDVLNKSSTTENNGTAKSRTKKNIVSASFAVGNFTPDSDVAEKNVANENNEKTKVRTRENSFAAEYVRAEVEVEYDEPAKIHKVVFGNGNSLEFDQAQFFAAGISSINLRIEKCDGNKKSILYQTEYSI